MQKALLLAVFVLTLHARENPFFPSEGEQDLPYTTNEIKNIEPLKRATLSLPPHARVLQKVTLEYKNIDGSIETKSISINNTIDWHLPVFVSQSYVDSVSVNTKQDLKETYKHVGSIEFAKFYVKNKIFKIETSDKMIRNFLLAEPHRIVIDFAKDATIKSYVKNNKNLNFKTIRVGNHKGYYRVVLELDGAYLYTLNPVSNGYEIILR